MATIPSVLRALARPLVALAAVLAVLAAVIPAVAKPDGTWCIGAVGRLAPEAWTEPPCDHCIPVGAPPPAGLPEPVLRTAGAAEAPVAAVPLVASHHPPVRIRGPPRPTR